LETLGSGLRATPFIWPLRSGSGTPSTSPQDRFREREKSDAGYAGDMSVPEGSAESEAMGTSTARPQMQNHSRSSELLRKLRSGHAGSGMGSPFGGSEYRSLSEVENSTPSRQARHTANKSAPLRRRVTNALFPPVTPSMPVRTATDPTSHDSPDLRFPLIKDPDSRSRRARPTACFAGEASWITKL
jgi:hypothetical protein